MVGMGNKMWVVCVVVLVLNLGCYRAEPQVPCYFIFGDSLVDNGNNNQLRSLARADYLPYGIDFGGPTGRFSNGKTTVDVVGKLLLHSHFVLQIFHHNWHDKMSKSIIYTVPFI